MTGKRLEIYVWKTKDRSKLSKKITFIVKQGLNELNLSTNKAPKRFKIIPILSHTHNQN
jgi:hypothetical protein